MSNDNLESKRWWIAVAAVVMQLCLGTVYAWSVFKKPLMGTHGWAETPTQVTFMICIAVIGIAAAFGGALVDKKGPRFVATIGGILFGLGTLLAGLADQMGSIWLLYLGFGLIAGLGNGFGYITNLLYLFDQSGTPIQHPQAGGTGARLPTNIIPLGRLYTGASIVCVDATEAVYPFTVGDILDGNRITVTDADGTQLIFEFDCGPDVRTDRARCATATPSTWTTETIGPRSSLIAAR